jgi:hypothetical protein
MPKSTSFWDHPIAKLEEALSLRKQIAALQDKLGGLFGSDVEPRRSTSSAPKAAKASPAKRKGKRTMSPEAREKIAAAQRARWAKSKGTSAAVAKAPAATSKKKKRKLSPEGRARIVAALKARWAAKRAGT